MINFRELDFDEVIEYFQRATSDLDSVGQKLDDKYVLVVVELLYNKSILVGMSLRMCQRKSFLQIT